MQKIFSSRWNIWSHLTFWRKHLAWETVGHLLNDKWKEMVHCASGFWIWLLLHSASPLAFCIQMVKFCNHCLFWIFDFLLRLMIIAVLNLTLRIRVNQESQTFFFKNQQKLKVSKSRKIFGILNSSKKRMKHEKNYPESSKDSFFKCFVRFFGRIDNSKNCFWDLLTFRS